MTKTDLREQITYLANKKTKELYGKYSKKAEEVTKAYIESHKDAIAFLDSLPGKLHTAFETVPELKHYMYAFRVSIDVEHMFTIDRFQVDPKRFFGSDTNNKALEGITYEYKKEAMEARKEYQRIDKLISETSAKRAFTILKEAGLPLEEKEILNLPTALNRLQLDLSKLGINKEG